MSSADSARPAWIGLALVAAFAGWPLLSHGMSGEALAFAAVCLSAAAAWAAGRLLSRIHPLLVGGAVATAVAMVFLIGLPESLSGHALAPPLGYGNANGALLSAAVAGLMSCWRSVPPKGRFWLIVASALLTLAAVLTASLAAAVTCLLLVVVTPLVWSGRAWSWQVVSGAAMAIGLLSTITLGLSHGGGGPLPSVSPAEALLSEVRPALWRDALELAASRPLTGVGVGEFAALSPTAADPDLAWAHSAPLQVLAETGSVGLLLMLCLVTWLLWRLSRGAALLAILVLQPTIDYVLHFPVVTLALALVLGGVSNQLRLCELMSRDTRPGLDSNAPPCVRVNRDEPSNMDRTPERNA